eukprot:TRINITY_DN50938_c0_g1_i1.p1 TRINITY_DN50938_c0_g1~~TRINITY_DN50938_c0_g1_i1.p1  ORF type:complete len:302 (+),score=27.53 TRINITY_DN50938_c0_g1_i1:50-955(+)
MAAHASADETSPRTYMSWDDFLQRSASSVEALPRSTGFGGLPCDSAEVVDGIDVEFTARNSWSLTIYAALERLGLLPAQSKGTQERLLLHVLGVDSREGRTPAEVAACFSQLAQLLAGQCSAIELVLVGPNVLFEGSHEFRLSDIASHSAECDSPLLLIHFGTGLYHEVARNHGSIRSSVWAARPVARFCMNAGLWGYDSWLETLDMIVCSADHRAPLIVTSYNAHEAEDDLDVLEQLELQCTDEQQTKRRLSDTIDWLWKPEPNPFRSFRVRQGDGSRQPQQENLYWQCIKADAGTVVPP